MDGDALAGVTDIFGGLTRDELDRALDELAFKRGDDTVDADVEGALADYYLVAVEHGGDALLAPGPVAFPDPPEYAEDLPHILDVDPRKIPRDALAAAVRDRLDADAAAAEPGSDRAQALIDVTYDADAWAPVDLGDVRERLRE